MENLGIEHPSGLLDPGTVNRIRSGSAAAEQLRALHPEQLSLIHERKWFKLFVPRAFGGLELSLPEGLRLEESLAWADGSLGWTVTLCSGANLFIGFLDSGIREMVFGDEQVCLAGSGHPSGTAKMKGDAFEIDGRWKYASGAPYATAFTANCLIEKESEKLPGDSATPLIKAFLFLEGEVMLHDDWQSMGMIATASQSFSVNQLKIPASRSFIIDPRWATLPGAIYQYPFLPFAETTLAVNSSGMAARFIELAEMVFDDKGKALEAHSNAMLAEKIAVAKSGLQSRRLAFYEAVQTSWNICETGNAISRESLNEVSTASRQLAKDARAMVDELYPFCGMVAANPSQEINRVWRNLHTASQHSLLLFPQS